MRTLALLALALAAAAPSAATEALSGDARGRSDVRFVTVEDVDVQVYSDGSFWLNLPERRESLQLKTTGDALHFDASGAVLGEGRWNGRSGTVTGLKRLSEATLGKIARAVVTARTAEGGARLVPVRGDDAAPARERAASPIEWGDGP